MKYSHFLRKKKCVFTVFKKNSKVHLACRTQSQLWNPLNSPTIQRPTCLHDFLHADLSIYLGKYPYRAILETCELWDILSEWWGDRWPMRHWLHFLTIENTDLNIHCDPSIKSDRGQHFKSSAMFLKLHLNTIRFFTFVHIFWLEVSVTKVPQYPHCRRGAKQERPHTRDVVH